MKTYRIICLIVCILLLGFHIYSLHYQDLSFSTNKGHYLGVVAMAFVGLSFLIGIVKEKKK